MSSSCICLRLNNDLIIPSRSFFVLLRWSHLRFFVSLLRSFLNSRRVLSPLVAMQVFCIAGSQKRQFCLWSNLTLLRFQTQFIPHFVFLLSAAASISLSKLPAFIWLCSLVVVGALLFMWHFNKLFLKSFAIKTFCAQTLRWTVWKHPMGNTSVSHSTASFRGKRSVLWMMQEMFWHVPQTHRQSWPSLDISTHLPRMNF